MTPAELFGFLDDLGQKTAWRRIRLTGSAGLVRVEMEDIAHAMVCSIAHDGARVTAVTPEFRRYPMNTCTGAGEPLQSIVGMAVGADFPTFFAGGRARRNCTHMLDLAWLGVVHAARGEVVRDYRMEMPDQVPGAGPIRLFRDGALLLAWQLDQEQIVAPPPFAGQPLFRGFTRWALEQLRGDLLEAALVLQKAWFVGTSRAYNMPEGPLSVQEQQLSVGACHGYGAERVAQAVRLTATRRDFTHHPERLLAFA